MKKIIKCLPILSGFCLFLPFAPCASTSIEHSAIVKKDAFDSQQFKAKVSYELGDCKKIGIDLKNDEQCNTINYDEDYTYWYTNDPNCCEESFNDPYFCDNDSRKLMIETSEENNNDRFVYQQIKVNVTMPAHAEHIDVKFQARFNEIFTDDCYYNTFVQLFDLGEDEDNHPEKFNRRLVVGEPKMDKLCCYWRRSRDYSGVDYYNRTPNIYQSNVFNWSFSNDEDNDITFTKYLGLSYYIQGDDGVQEKSSSEAKLEVTLASNFDQLSPDLGVENAEIAKWGDIYVRYTLSNDYTCHLKGYEYGHGTLMIPDHIDYAGEPYYLREIPSNWSDGENNINGLLFSHDCKHLTKICDEAFKNTECFDFDSIDRYTPNPFDIKDNCIEFPEGLEEIGASAFYGTCYGSGYMKGYKFPSTLKKIGSKAFAHCPWIEGYDNDGEIWFKSVPEIATDAFDTCASRNDTRYVYGSTMEIAKANADFLRNKTTDFNVGDEYLIPKVEEKKN